MIQAIVYKIEGPRSVSEAIKEFNKLDHSKKLFGNKSGISNYLKSKVGPDFYISSLTKRYGLDVEEQIVEDKGNKYDIHIKIKEKAVGKSFNAVLIINRDFAEDLMRPIYMIDCGNIDITETNWVNIIVPKSKISL